MNRIISININGIVFNVDETAYERLRIYLDALHRHFRGTEGKEEIMADIEARIAEMLQQELKGSKEVVMLAEVEKVIAAMGHPEDFTDTETGSGDMGAAPGNQSYSRENYDRPKRLYRNTDHRVLGGVCSGIAAYFNTDPIWIRLLFLVAFFGFGSGLLLYIILWIIIPAARTAAEKLEMRGYDVNISNLEKSFKGEMHDVKKNWTENGRNNVGGFFSELFNALGRALKVILPIVARIFGVIFLFIGISALIGIIITVLAVLGVVSASLPSIITDTLGSEDNMWLVSLGISLAVGIPFLALTYYGVRLLFNIKFDSRWIGLSFFVLWIAGIIMAGVAGSNTAKRFAKEVEITETDSLPMQDTLYLNLNRSQGKRITIRNNGRITSRMVVIRTDDDDIDLSRVKFDIQRSPDNQFHLLKEKTARGESHSEATQLANGIDYRYTVKDSVLTFDETFSLQKETSWRAQDLKLILQVPVGKVVYMRDGMQHIIYDIDNLQDVYDNDMVNRKWLMTQQGLSCLDCPKRIIRNKDEDDSDEDANVEVGKDGVHINVHHNNHYRHSFSVVLM